ncbi:MAG TPA: 5'/3'-nucleotidase SurE [Candidatus Fermentibacter daniensis]|nr:5'/3'-nucleotidase SurE [Candidatus Fermentibacter daniensis]HOR06705.1 5'/3'-nucleotidase SurE [Candidatus Fermentibacter daniensis]HPK50934.1 5'/3'-nucleotidase SurE [Candidatus Fermentibacter daniensis]
MRVLVTNDDGIDAPGLEALASALSDDWDAYVVAPSGHCSGTGHALTLYRDLSVEKRGDRSWCVGGTPADCVKLALGELLGFSPDVVVSGINPGPNMANNVHYSGTIAAASEAAFWNIPSIAVSSGSQTPRHLGCTGSYVRKLLLAGVHRLIPRSCVLSLNIPDLPLRELGQPVWTRTARFSADAPFIVLDPGRSYRYGRMPDPTLTDPSGTDVEALKAGLVSATLLGLDRSLPGFDLPPIG